MCIQWFSFDGSFEAFVFFFRVLLVLKDFMKLISIFYFILFYFV